MLNLFLKTTFKIDVKVVKDSNRVKMPNCKCCGEWCYPIDIKEHEKSCKGK